MFIIRFAWWFSALFLSRHLIFVEFAVQLSKDKSLTSFYSNKKASERAREEARKSFFFIFRDVKKIKSTWKEK